jgi:hypothetical protein
MGSITHYHPLSSTLISNPHKSVRQYFQNTLSKTPLNSSKCLIEGLSAMYLSGFGEGIQIKKYGVLGLFIFIQ